jgi:Na+/phosphate symporter
MIALAIWPLVFAIVGVLMYALCANPKLSEIGRIIFFCGFFFLTNALAHATLQLAK